MFTLKRTEIQGQSILYTKMNVEVTSLPDGRRSPITVNYSVGGRNYEQDILRGSYIPEFDDIFTTAGEALFWRGKTVDSDRPTPFDSTITSRFELGPGINIGDTAELGLLWSPSNQRTVNLGDTVSISSDHLSFNPASPVIRSANFQGQTWLYTTTDVTVTGLPTSRQSNGRRTPIVINYSIGGREYSQDVLRSGFLKEFDNIFTDAGIALAWRGRSVVSNRPNRGDFAETSRFELGPGIKVGDTAELGLLWSPSNQEGLNVGDEVSILSDHLRFTEETSTSIPDPLPTPDPPVIPEVPIEPPPIIPEVPIEPPPIVPDVPIVPDPTEPVEPTPSSISTPVQSSSRRNNLVQPLNLNVVEKVLPPNSPKKPVWHSFPEIDGSVGKLVEFEYKGYAYNADDFVVLRADRLVETGSGILVYMPSDNDSGHQVQFTVRAINTEEGTIADQTLTVNVAEKHQ